MKKALFTFLLLFAATAMNAQTIVKGDMNDDKELTITDAVSVVDVILGNAPKQTIGIGGDPYMVDNTLVVGTWKSSGGSSFTLNEDGSTSLPEFATYKFRPYQGTLMFFDSQGKPVKTIVLGEVEKGRYLLAANYYTDTYIYYYRDESGSIGGRDYVDLGLPSGTLWATCNVGASSPEDYGNYIAWGEMSTKSTYDWSTYKWCNGSNTTLTKYCTKGSYGDNWFTDNKKELDPEDDAASVNWGRDWRMPSKEEFKELINSSYTTTEWTAQNGVYGRKITSNSNGNSIFLPAAGRREDSSLYSTGTIGDYWSRTLNESSPKYAWGLGFTSRSIDTSNYDRYSGFSVRPVRFSE
ncbi:MAG: hypothetical protein K6A96_03380 [Prevotella sp.]|nr:hypothetical protein [Prevotella sp.]